MQSNESYSSLSPVVHGDIDPSINTNYKKVTTPKQDYP